MKEIVILSLMLVLLSATSVMSEVTTCLDSDTAQLNISIYTNVDGLEQSTNSSETFHCNYGCYNGDCRDATILNESTFVMFFAIFIIMVWLGYAFKLPITTILGGVFLLLMALIMLSSGILINGMLYTTADNSYVTYLSILFILISIYTTVTGLGI